MHIAIPDLFACLNSAREFKSVSNENYMEVLKSAESAKASECIKCGKCEHSCPQNLNIRKLLEEVANEFEK